MLFWLKEEMAPQEFTRRLATVITHVGKWRFFKSCVLLMEGGGVVWDLVSPTPHSSPGMALGVDLAALGGAL